MRIAIVNWTGRKVGGIETYLNALIPQLRKEEHEVAFLCEVDEPKERESLVEDKIIPSWCVAERGVEQSLRELRRWQPDIIYAHGEIDPAFETKMLDIAPGVYFAHAYYGMCISGGKTFKSPIAVPCRRQFDWGCLIHYFPHRCGGKSPVTMAREFRKQSARRESMRRYAQLITHSDYMRGELINNGFDAARVHHLPFFVPPKIKPLSQATNCSGVRSPSSKRVWRLLFLGRMDYLKGGEIFLEALPRIARNLKRSLRITFAGDGPERSKWQTRAARLQTDEPLLKINFIGWADEAAGVNLFAQTDLLVIPSLWPEPFGMVGIEAGRHSIPCAAFDVGGISDWLREGVNGYLAAGNPPTADGLTEAIVKCLGDVAEFERLRRGAYRIAQEYTAERHVAELSQIFETVKRARRSD